MSIKKQIPINHNVHFEYECPERCGSRHWLSLREAQEKGFKVVCDCGTVFKPKRVINITINFAKKKPKEQKEEIKFPPQTRTQQVEPFDIKSFLSEAAAALTKFGFEKNEALELVNLHYNRNPTKDITALVKRTLLETFGANNYEQIINKTI